MKRKKVDNQAAILRLSQALAAETWVTGDSLLGWMWVGGFTKSEMDAALATLAKKLEYRQVNGRKELRFVSEPKEVQKMKSTPKLDRVIELLEELVNNTSPGYLRTLSYTPPRPRPWPQRLPLHPQARRMVVRG